MIMMILSDGINKWDLIDDPKTLINWLDTVELDKCHEIISSFFSDCDYLYDYLVVRLREEGDSFYS
jgi:hypothetical protein